MAFPGDWNFYRDITIDAAAIEGTTDFSDHWWPLRLDAITASNFWDEVETDGSDIVVTEDGEETELPRYLTGFGPALLLSGVETYALTNGWQLGMSLDGGTVVDATFETADFADIANATAAEIIAVLQADWSALAVTVSADANDRVLITADTFGASIQVSDVTGTPISALALPTALRRGSGLLRVRVPTMSATVDTVLQLYHGNPTAGLTNSALTFAGRSTLIVVPDGNDGTDISAHASPATIVGTSPASSNETVSAGWYDGVDDETDYGEGTDDVLRGMLDTWRYLSFVACAHPTQSHIRAFLVSKEIDSADPPANGNGWTLQMDTSDNIRLSARFGSNIGFWSSPTNSFLRGVDHHVVVAYSNSSTTINPIMIIDGVVVTVTETTTPLGSVLADNGPNPFMFGSNPNASNHFVGTIAELFVHEAAGTGTYDQDQAVSEYNFLFDAGNTFAVGNAVAIASDDAPSLVSLGRRPALRAIGGISSISTIGAPRT